MGGPTDERELDTRCGHVAAAALTLA